MRAFVIAGIGLALIAGGLYYVFAPSAGGNELGKGVPATAAVVRISEIAEKPESFKGREVAVTGKVVDLCPTTGHWGYLDDGTGRIRWDSGNGGWFTPQSWKSKNVSVQGVIRINEEGSAEIDAAGAKQ